MMNSRPYVILNVAMTADGKTDTIARRGAIISSESDKERVDRLRASSDAVMVGGHTLLGEDPRLVIRSPELRKERLEHGMDENPIKVAIVTRADLAMDSRFLNFGPARIIIFTTSQTTEAQIDALRERSVQVYVFDEKRVNLVAALDELGKAGVKKLLVDGGGTLNEELLKQDLVDEINVYVAPMIFGGTNAPTFASGPGLEREAAKQLKLLDIHPYDDGGIVLRYVVLKNV
jgi:2,5-diamino-6-hydroxy-4-(5-phosphoribosylamino)pyrimidine 1'-reductase